MKNREEGGGFVWGVEKKAGGDLYGEQRRR